MTEATYYLDKVGIKAHREGATGGRVALFPHACMSPCTGMHVSMYPYIGWHPYLLAQVRTSMYVQEK